MTSTIISSIDLNEYLSENAAEIVDSYEGCLLDNYLAYSTTAVYAIYEKYATANSSVYEVFTAALNTEDGAAVENTFLARQAAVFDESDN